MPPVRIQVTVDDQTAMADVYIDIDLPRTFTIPNPPDFTWTFTDANSHWHAYNAKGELPTLDMESVFVPDEEDGVAYFCKICRQQVTPATLPAPIDVVQNTRVPWAVRATLASAPARNRVSVHAQPAGQPIHFGTASVDSVTGIGPYQVDLIGEAPISKMKA